MFRNTVKLPIRRWYSSSHSKPGSNLLKSSLLFSSGLTIGAIGFYYTNKTATPANDVFPFTSSTPLNDLSSPVYGTDHDFKAAIEEFKAVLKADSISISASEIESHTDSYFNTHHAKEEEKPKVVVYPTTTEEVSKVLKIAHKYTIPIVPSSGLTSLEGNYIQTRSGIALDLSRMNKIISINKPDLDCIVQTGVGWQDLNEQLAGYDLMFGPDPGPGAQIGGMIATSCSGTNAFKYGTIKENVLGLTVVLADGTIIKTRQRPRKSAAGYNLNGVFIGSEGTLGIITEAALKVYIKPKKEIVSIVSFNTIEEAAQTAQDILSNGIQPNAIEIVDSMMMKYVNEGGLSSRKWLEKPTLFFKIGGSSDLIIKETVNQIKSAAKKNNNISFEFARDEEESANLWEARKLGLWSTIDWGRKELSKDIKVWTTDVAVPISKLATMVKETDEDVNSAKLQRSVMGHIGDGNIHFVILYDQAQYEITKTIVDRMVDRALKYDGTCTGEHGVGYGKRSYLVKELGEEAIDTMRKLKLALDPKRILNPDKVFKIDPQDTEH